MLSSIFLDQRTREEIIRRAKKKKEPSAGNIKPKHTGNHGTKEDEGSLAVDQTTVSGKDKNSGKKRWPDYSQHADLMRTGHDKNTKEDL